MRVEASLAAAVTAVPHKTALIAGDRRVTYAELDRLSDTLAAAFVRYGATAGERVALVLDNSIEAAVAIFAALKAGAIFTPVHPAGKVGTLAAVFASAQPRVIVSGVRQLVPVREAVERAGVSPVLLVAGGEARPGVVDLASLLTEEIVAPAPGGARADDLGMIIYTSGSTGRPKGVMMSHAAMLAALDAVIERLEARDDDVILSTLPFAFSYGLHQLLMIVRTQGTLVIENSFAFPNLIFEKIRAEGVTAMPLVPATIAAVLSQRELKREDLPTLRYITSASAPLSAEQAARLSERLPGVDLHVMYGQSECKRIAMLSPARLHDKQGSVGIAIPGTQAFVADADGRPLPAGETGELVVRGPHLMRGYWNDAEATAAALHPDPEGDGVLLFTGDLFRADADGYLWFVARKDDVIKTRGEKVAPAEVEAALLACPGVREALVFAKPDPVLGQAVHALVVADDVGLAERDLQRACARVLEDFKVPRSISIRADLPRTDNGKASRRLAAEIEG